MIWDVIIVGAGPAGCAAAYELAAAGRQVLLIDKASFPRPKACAGGLTSKAVRALRYPIAPVVRHTAREIHLEHSSAPGGFIAVRRNNPICVMTVRAEFDAYCLDQTLARGAAFRRVGPITSLREQADRVLLTMEGDTEPLAARFVLGADGVHSRIRVLQGEAAWFRTGFAVEANVAYSVMRRRFPVVFDFAPVSGGYGWLFPRNDHVNVGLYAAGDGHVDRAALTAYIAARCGTSEHERVVGQFLGLGAAGYTPLPGRVLLAGDAAGFVDPLTGEGIYGAIASGQAAAAAMLHCLRHGGSAATSYTSAIRRLRADLSVAESAARRFYKEPARGFWLMQHPLMRRAVVHSYSEGSSLALLARGLELASRLRARAQA